MRGAEKVTSAAPAPYSRSYRRGAIILLFAIYTFNCVDRSVMNILAESIRIELHLADWQLGVMSGLSFALLYATLGIPIARLAERHNRPKIIASAVVIWSIATAICGLCRTFPQIALARLVVGVGEAGGTPPSHSLIADYTPAKERGAALALYSMGIPVGGLLGLALGGIVAAHFGWRLTFIIAGTPGIALALLALFFLREPRSPNSLAKRAEPTLSLRKSLGVLFRIPTFRYLLLSSGAMSITGYATSVYLAPFFLRVHSAELQQLSSNAGLKPIAFLGLVLGLCYGIPGIIGMMVGGKIADKWGNSNISAYMVLPAIAALICTPFYVLVFSLHNIVGAFACSAALNLFSVCYVGPLHATAQNIVPPQLRATVSAVLLFNITIVGLGLGPVALGAISDIARHTLHLNGGESLRLALISAAITLPVASLAFWIGSSSLQRDFRE